MYHLFLIFFFGFTVAKNTDEFNYGQYVSTCFSTLYAIFYTLFYIFESEFNVLFNYPIFVFLL